MRGEEAMIQVKQLHELYMQALTELYNQNKNAYHQNRRSEMRFVQ